MISRTHGGNVSMSNQGKGLVSSRIQLKILRNNLFAYLSCRAIYRVIFWYLQANFQKISFNVISKVSVKGMDDDDNEEEEQESDDDNDNIYDNNDDGEEEEKISW